MRKYLIGIFIGMALMFSMSAFADDIKSLIGLKVQGEYPISINGKTLDSKAEVINGTSYLPVRSIADAIAYDTKFDVNTGISLSKKEVNTMSVNNTDTLGPGSTANPLATLQASPSPQPQPLTKKDLDLQLDSQYYSIIGGLYLENSTTSLEKARADILKIESQETSLLSGYSLVEINEVIDNLNARSQSYQAVLEDAKKTNKYSEIIQKNIESFIQILNDKLVELEAQKAALTTGQ